MINSSIDEIKARLNIVDVIGEYVRLNKAGINWKALCPFHNEKGASFMVNEEKQFYHCFGCGKSGDMFSFVMDIESLEFREALKLLAEKAGVQLEAYVPKAGEKKDRTLEILELATKFYETQLWKGMGKERIMRYLHERGISDDSVRSFRLGYAPPGWDNVLKFLVGRGYEAVEIAKTGLLVQKEGGAGFYDRFRDRIMFPVADSMGKVVGYSARVAPGGDETQAKYINTPETAVYHKSKVLYGLDLAKREIKNKNSVLLVEGNMDVIAASQAGIKNVVAVSGTALTAEQIDTLKRYSHSISMLFDMDSAGQNAAKRSADLCFQKEVAVKMVKLEGAKDAAEMAEKNPEELTRAVQNGTDAMEYFLDDALAKNDKQTSEGKKAIATEFLQHLVNVSNQIEKMHWIGKIAQEVGVEEKTIIGVLKSLQTQNRFDAPEKVSSSSAENVEDEFQKRSEKVRNMILGLLLIDSVNWQKIVESGEDFERLRQDQLLNYALEKGAKVEYSFEKLLLQTENEKMTNFLRKVYFDAKYHFDNMQNIVEYSQEEIFKLTKQYIHEFVKELQKEQLSDIIKNIRKAEQSGDKEALNLLMREFTKLSHELK